MNLPLTACRMGNVMPFPHEIPSQTCSPHEAESYSLLEGGGVSFWLFGSSYFLAAIFPLFPSSLWAIFCWQLSDWPRRSFRALSSKLRVLHVILSQGPSRRQTSSGYRTRETQTGAGGLRAGRDCHLPDRRRPLASACACACASASFSFAPSKSLQSPAVCSINEISFLTSDFPSPCPLLAVVGGPFVLGFKCLCLISEIGLH